MEKKKVESFIIPLPILEKRLLYSRSNKTIGNPVSIQPVVEPADGCKRKMRFVPLFLVQNRGPIR
jgi:hypothetical protein